jgi:hypothetical protein
MPLLISLADARDIVIIIYGIIGIIFFAVALVVILMVGLMARGLLKRVKELLDESVKPALDSVKDAAQTVRGTTEFIGRTAVTPVARAYGAAAGVKKGLSVLSGLKGRGAK